MLPKLILLLQVCRGGSRKPLTIIPKHSILDVAAALDLPLGLLLLNFAKLKGKHPKNTQSFSCIIYNQKENTQKTPNLFHVSYITRRALRTLSKQGTFLRQKSTSVRKILERLKEKLRDEICLSVRKVRHGCFFFIFKYFKNNICTEQL